MLYVVIGPPAGGKSTWVNERAKPGDIVIDYDRLANSLTAIGAKPHGHKRPLATVAFRAREAAITEALRHVGTHAVFIIHSLPRPGVLARYRKAGAEIVTVDPGRSVVEARCRAERPDDYMDGVKRWYASHARQPEPEKRNQQVSAVPVSGGSRKW